MEGRRRILFLGQTGIYLLVLLVLFARTAWSAENADPQVIQQQQPPIIQPEVERQKIDTDAIDTEDFEIGLFVGAMNVENFGTNLVYGARAAYHVTEDLFGEFAVGQTDTSKTSFEKLSGGAEIIEDRTLTYYNISLGYNILPGETFIGSSYAFTNALYLIGGVGVTDFNSDNKFTWNFGAGYRLLLTDYLSLRLDARDHVFKLDVLGEDETLHNLELTVGLSYFF